MHAPRKRFGQHFLHDQQVIANIVATIAPTPQDHLVEIGPGRGALTLPLLDLCQKLEVIEFDRDLLPILEKAGQGRGELIIHECDALQFDFQSLKSDARKLRVVGNLPYNISTPLIFHLLSYAPIIKDMVFMLQKEVAERIAAPTDGDDYGRLSVMTQYFCQTEIILAVPPEAFDPPPKVESSIIKLIPYTEPPYPANNYAHFEQLVKAAFNQRRKTLRNSLKHIVSADVWAASGIASSLRAETLNVADFVNLSNLSSAELS